MSGQSRSSTSLIVGFVVVALIGIGGNYALDTLRRDGRAAANRVNNELRAAEQGLADLGAAEAAYIISGQNIEAASNWMNAATSHALQLDSALANLRTATTSAEARTHYDLAVPLVESVSANDRKARGLAGSGQWLVAADVVLVEGAETVKQLKVELAAARNAEMAGFETKATELGWIGLGGNAALLVVGLLLVMVAARRASSAASEMNRSLDTRDAAPAEAAPAEAPVAVSAPSAPGPGGPGGNDAWLPPSPDLSRAADLCVELGLVEDGAQLTALMARAANVLEAKGLVLWVSESGGSILRPTIAHGYSERVLQRMGTLPTDGDNVTSLAFRSRQPQVVRGSIDGQGALAVPVITATGCVGVLAAEVQGAKPGDARFAIARIIAAQLSTLVAPSVSAETRRTAAQS